MKRIFRNLRNDTCGDPGLNAGHWIALVIGAVVVLAVLAALFPTLTAKLDSYAANDTSGFGDILVSIVPIVLGAAVLLAFVAAFKVSGMRK